MDEFVGELEKLQRRHATEFDGWPAVVVQACLASTQEGFPRLRKKRTGEHHAFTKVDFQRPHFCYLLRCP